MKEIIKKIKYLEIHINKIIEGILHGNYKSVFKGNGLDFSELAEYIPGDDIRNIDWNVTARFNKPYIKKFIEERDLQVYCVVDISNSSTFGSVISKKEKIVELAATIAASAIKNNDKVGMFLVTNKIEKYIPLRKGKKHLFKIIKELINFQPKNIQTNLNTALISISKIIKKKSIIFIISDFVTEDFSKSIKSLNKKHDIIAIKITDPNEIEIPDVGYIQLEDSENHEQILVNTSDLEFRENYKNEITKYFNNLNILLKKYKIDVLNVNTNQDYINVFRNYFVKRLKREKR